MDSGDLVLFGAIGVGAYLLLYKHQQQQVVAAPTGPLGASTGSVIHQCPQGYDWVPDASAAGGGTCVLKGSVTTT